MKKACLFACAFLFFSFTVLPAVTQAQSPDPLGVRHGARSGLGAKDIRTTTAEIINVALGLLGIVALVLIVYAGFMWMTSGGNDDQVTKAKKVLFSSVIGLALILSAYSISRFVTTQLYSATTGIEYEMGVEVGVE